ncbi:ClC family H(+)/Cl(-) exchange transporter, partial [Proteus mirabilis]|nr:ClC family H(+)/Cl(-) exchange transporter [Proteus mirabilis]MCD4626681.1 ClC family H(+)/Cl(-) exchange transporter [Proteus mirabilis]
MYQRNTIKKSQNQQRFNWFRKAKETNLAPVKTLILSAIIGTLAGLIGVLFEKAVGWVIHL